MDQRWDKPLESDQRPNPIIRTGRVGLEGIHEPTPEELAKIFTTGKHSLQTWGRKPGVKRGAEPHWIGVFKPGPLHTDRAYPRMTHHLVLKVDPGFFIRGHNREETPLERGTILCLDTHSPHQIQTSVKGASWYVAVSVDSAMPIALSKVRGPLLEYARTTPVVTPDVIDR